MVPYFWTSSRSCVSVLIQIILPCFFTAKAFISIHFLFHGKASNYRIVSSSYRIHLRDKTFISILIILQDHLSPLWWLFLVKYYWFRLNEDHILPADDFCLCCCCCCWFWLSSCCSLCCFCCCNCLCWSASAFTMACISLRAPSGIDSSPSSNRPNKLLMIKCIYLGQPFDIVW